MKSYLDRLLSEKGISPDHVFQIETNDIWGTHFVPLEVLVEFLTDLPKSYQDQIRKTLIQVDFVNGSVLHYLEHLTKGMIESTRKDQ